MEMAGRRPTGGPRLYRPVRYQDPTAPLPPGLLRANRRVIVLCYSGMECREVGGMAAFPARIRTVMSPRPAVRSVDPAGRGEPISGRSRGRAGLAEHLGSRWTSEIRGPIQYRGRAAAVTKEAPMFQRFGVVRMLLGCFLAPSATVKVGDQTFSCTGGRCSPGRTADTMVVNIGEVGGASYFGFGAGRNPGEYDPSYAATARSVKGGGQFAGRHELLIAIKHDGQEFTRFLGQRRRRLSRDSTRASSPARPRTLSQSRDRSSAERRTPRGDLPSSRSPCAIISALG